MTFYIEPEELTKYDKRDLEFTAEQEFDINYDDETRFLSDTVEDTTHRIIADQIKIAEEVTGESIPNPFDALEHFVDKYQSEGYALSALRDITLETGVDGRSYVGIQAINKFFDKMYAIKNDPRYKDNPFVKTFVTSQEDVDNYIANEAINNEYASNLLQQNDYRSGFLEFTGRASAQLFDDPATALYFATLPLIYTPIGAISSAVLRTAAWIGEGAIGATIIEGYQQTGTRKLRDMVDLRITNPEVRAELESFGIDVDTLGVSDEELNSRLEYAWIGGALFGGGAAILGESARFFMKRVMAGDELTMQTINKMVNDVRESGLNDTIVQNMKPDELVSHFKKIAKEGNNINFNKDYQPQIHTVKQPIEDFDKAIDEIESKLLLKGEKLNKNQRQSLKSTMRYHNYSVDLHNAVVKNQLLKYTSETGEWKLKLADTTEETLLKNADELVSNFKKIQSGSANEKWFLSTLQGTKSGLRNFLDKDAYLESLSKNADERSRQVLDDLALVNLLNTVMKHYAKLPTRRLKRTLGLVKRKQSMQQIITDVLEVSYGRDVISQNVSSIQRATRQDFMNRLDVPELHKMDVKKINKFHGNNIVREIYGENTGDAAAKTLAKQINLMFDDIYQVATKFGMVFNKLDNFFPQTHVSYKVGQVEKNQWVDEILPALDKDKTGKLLDLDPDAEDFDELMKSKLAEIYDNIVLGDTKSAFANVDESFKLRLKNAHSRVLFFKDADSWLNYNKKYGKDVLSLLDNYMDHASMEIAMLRVFGPNVIRNAKRLDKFAKNFDDKAGIGAGQSLKFSRMFDHISGAEFAIAGRKTAKVMSETRALLVTAQLGSAYIMTLADLSYGALTRLISGMPATKTVNNYVKFLANSKNSKALAREARVVAHEIGEEFKNSSRFAGEKFENGFMSWAANKLMKVSLLAPGTAASRTAFKYEFQFHLRELAKKRFEDLDSHAQYMYRRYGITKADHEALSKQKLYTSKYDAKVKYLRVGDIEDEALRHKYYAYMFAETEAAVPTVMARSRAFMMNSTRAGTLSGEAARSFWLFKNFPMTIMYTQLARTANVMLTHPSHAARIGYPTGLLVFTTLMGTLLYQIRNLIKGEDPAAMNTSTITKGMMYGGGLGFFADVVLQDTSQYGRSTMAGIAGPVFGLLDDFSKLGLKPIHDALYRNKNSLDQLPGNIITFLAKYTPYNNLWYTRAASNSLIFDNLRQNLDPKYNQKLRRREQRLYKEHRGLYVGPGFEFRRPPKWENIYTWKPPRD